MSMFAKIHMLPIQTEAEVAEVDLKMTLLREQADKTIYGRLSVGERSKLYDDAEEVNKRMEIARIQAKLHNARKVTGDE